MSFETKIAPLCTFLEETIRESLIAQDHVATGKLRDSLKVIVRKTAYGYVIEGKGAGYGKYVDSGRRPHLKRVPLDVLIEWIRIKGIHLNGRKDRDVAFAIQSAIYKNGIPSNKDMSKVGFATKKLEENEGRVRQDITESLSELLSIELHNIVWDTQKML